ncbi:protein YIPF5-like isoform X1 [Varroa jacobsoni]|uniref:Protein YIPF n=2 Tax=Varroa destructor TaxID=109461 RepID=A0A7M7KIL7_VARDE|nr:protein YIPF5-like isoform X1 [Varroa destructor]XP_022711385.1 protein YIPF5-like isoform X1 [Varroa jacobsoni]
MDDENDSHERSNASIQDRAKDAEREHKFILKMESGNQQSLYYDPWSQQQQQPFMNMPMNNLTTDSKQGEFDNEPPLLEELGINVNHIWDKTLAVLNPLRKSEATILNECDLAGPLVFCLAFGCFLMLAGKIHFGYIYGLGLVGTLSLYALLNLMSHEGISIGTTVSVLGYCLLPIVLLSGFSIVISLKGAAGTFSALLSISWCAYSASKLFVTALSMDHQQMLVLYPCALVYGVFALLTIF